MSILQIKHTSETPAWLSNWLTARDFRALFSAGIINAACKILQKPGTSLSVNWLSGGAGFQAQIGVFCATWRYHEGIWQPSCSCNYPNKHCLHTYGAGFLLVEVCRQENWSLSGQSMPPPQSQRILQEDRPKTQGIQLDLFDNQEQKQPRVRKCQLEVEVDLQHEAGRVGIRFYCREDDRRSLLKLGTLRSYTQDLRDSRRCHLRYWPEQDKLFMRFVQPMITKGFPHNNNLTMLNIAAAEFQSWREKWQTAPERFLNRATQQAILPVGMAIPVRQHVELSEDGEFIKVAVFFTFTNGERQQPQQILRNLANDPNSPITRRELLKFTPPIPWSLLSRHFDRGPVRILRQQVLSKLSVLLAGRLDLIVAGPCVSQEKHRPDQAELFFDQRPGAFLLSCLVDGKAVPLENIPQPKNSIRAANGKFLISVVDSSEICEPIRQALLPFIKRNGSFADQQAVILSNHHNALALRQFWQSLPNTIVKHCSPALLSLLEEQPSTMSAIFQSREQHGLLEVSCTLLANDQTISAVELKNTLGNQGTLLRSNSGWLSIDPDKAQKILDQLESEGYDEQPKLMLKSEAGRKLGQLCGQDGFTLNDSTRSYLDSLRSSPIPEVPPAPASLQAILRPYQVAGYTFLADRCLNGAGSILADDMGLGKTLQVLALLLAWKQREKQGFAALVICPASVMSVWKEQAAKFCPELSVLIWAGSKQKRQQAFAEGNYDLLITHYGMARIEVALLASRTFSFIILDEAQAIKNPDAQVSRAVKKLPCQHRLAMTGTPLENKLLDLWSIMDFLNPKFLGPKENFLVPGQVSPSELRARLSLLLLRRSKSLVAAELPARIVEVLPVELENAQRDFYDRTLLETKRKIKAFGPIEILAGLTRLRQICCDPELYLKKTHELGGAKLALLLEKLSEVLANGHSALVFSQYTQMLAIIARELSNNGLPHRSITGKTPLPQRGAIVQEFTDDEQPGVLLLSLKAAGTGLTLTKADYVFLYDPWWNPAVENQAIDRTHRLGQDKTVMAYRMVVKDSIEERVLSLMQEKQELFDAVVGEVSDAAVCNRLTREDLLRLLQ